MQTMLRTARHLVRSRLAGALAGVLAAALLVPTAQAQSDVFQQAKEAYQFGEYDKAIERFRQVAENTSADKQMRRRAMRYMGRAHVAQGDKEEAQQVMEQLIKTEPPLVELSPDKEPPPLWKAYYQARKEVNGSYQVEGPGLQTIAVMDFRNNSITNREQYDGLEKGLSSMMINYMNGTTDLKVIERERIEWLLDEIELQQSGKVNQSTAVRTGELLGANTVVFGSFTVAQDQMQILARVVKVETGEVLLGEQVRGEPGEFFSLIEDLSTQVAESVDAEVQQAKAKKSSRTKSLDAMMAYSQGLKLIESGDYRQAHEKLMQAHELDPEFTRARDRARSLQPMLAGTDGEGAGSSSSGR
jgi:TolA-binding protein